MDDKQDILTCEWQSPVGTLLLGAIDGALCMCDWPNSTCGDTVRRRLCRIFGGKMVAGESPVLEQAKKQLTEYFEGSRKSFDLPLRFAGSEFQQQLWSALCEIPYGHTVSYGQLADSIGKASAVRAVASACGKNAISIIVPCHRVIGADGKLTGYAGGIEVKARLLKIEGE